MQEIRAQASKINVPCLVVYSGADTVVAKADIEQVINDIKHCESLLIPEALHELFFEKDKFRVPALTKILTYLSTP